MYKHGNNEKNQRLKYIKILTGERKYTRDTRKPNKIRKRESRKQTKTQRTPALPCTIRRFKQVYFEDMFTYPQRRLNCPP